MRICFVTPEYTLHPPYGGIATYTCHVARWLVAHGHDVHVVLVSRAHASSTEKDEGVLVHTVPTQRIKPRRLLAYAGRVPGLSGLREAYAGWNLLEDSIGVWKAVDRLSGVQRFDVVEATDTLGLGFWGTLRPRRTTPILIRSHGYVDPDLPGFSWPGARFELALERYSVRHADFVLPVSAERVAHYQAMFDLDPAKIGALVSGIVVPELPDTDAGIGQVERGVRILYIGRVELRKGCDILFDALKIVHQRQPSARVTFVGPVGSDMEHAFAAFLQETTSWVHYLGAVPQEEVITHLRQGDMIVLPSRLETLPRILMEALAAGVPQVTSAANGIPEIVEHGVTGLVVDPVTPEALAEGIVCLSSSPELRASMSQQSRQRALARFEINSVMEKQVRVYQALGAGKSPLPILAG